MINNKFRKNIFLLGHGDWGLGIGDWAQSPIPKSPFISNHELIDLIFLKIKLN